MSSTIRSMTGFARVRRALPEGELVVSLKSVNHRGLDLHFRLPPEFDEFEQSIRTAIKGRASRGHFQVNVFYGAENGNQSKLNRDLLQSWLAAFADAAARFDLDNKPDLNAAFRIPGMFQSAGPATIGPEFGKILIETTMEALDTLNVFREREGVDIGAELRERSTGIRDLVARMETIRKGATAAFQKRLKERLGELLRTSGIEPQRIAQEAALLADRSDISEELIRLKTHAAQLEELLDAGGEMGKKMDFLLQEMNREANTILSKTGGLGDIGLAMTDLALAAKAEIDKIREQALNLE
ncbi:MAG: YicC family protein [Acidobacteriota bacterium]|nr:YicC family protein [Acidobacteriota bacterium]